MTELDRPHRHDRGGRRATNESGQVPLRVQSDFIGPFRDLTEVHGERKVSRSKQRDASQPGRASERARETRHGEWRRAGTRRKKGLRRDHRPTAAMPCRRDRRTRIGFRQQLVAEIRPSAIDDATTGTSRGEFLQVINPHSHNGTNEDSVVDSDQWRWDDSFPPTAAIRVALIFLSRPSKLSGGRDYD